MGIWKPVWLQSPWIPPPSPSAPSPAKDPVSISPVCSTLPGSWLQDEIVAAVLSCEVLFCKRGLCSFLFWEFHQCRKGRRRDGKPCLPPMLLMLFLLCPMQCGTEEWDIMGQNGRDEKEEWPSVIPALTVCLISV